LAEIATLGYLLVLGVKTPNPGARMSGPRPAPVRYALTDLGWTLVDVLSAVRSWAEEHIVEVLAARAATRD